MHKLIGWYNENTEKFWIIIILIVSVIAFTQIANNYYKNKKEDTGANTNVSSARNTINNEIDGKLESTTSLIQGSGVSKNKLEKETAVIDTFIKYCNEGQVENAYNLLTDECKEEIFPSLESFKSKYHNSVFKTYKTYNVQNYFGDTYKLKLTEDALTTGKVGANSPYLQEYMTIVEKDSDYKLNINNYIGRTEINKTSTVEGIKIEVQSKETYMDYSEYTIKIQNTTENTILLDDGKRADNIYLLDENNVKEYANTGEIIYSNLKLLPMQTKKYTFRFSNTYSNTRKMKRLVFKNVIMNYEEYNNISDKNDYEKFETITVNV